MELVQDSQKVILTKDNLLKMAEEHYSTKSGKLFNKIQLVSCFIGTIKRSLYQ